MDWKPPPLPVRLPMTHPIKEYFETKKGRRYLRFFNRCELMTSDGYPCGHQRRFQCEMDTHVQNHHSLMDCPVEGCPQKGLYDIWALALHYKLNHQGYVRCSICNRQCQSWRNFQDHARMENCQDPLGPLVCQFCEDLSLNEDLFCLHLLEEHIKVPDAIIEEQDILQLLREAKEARPPADPEAEAPVNPEAEAPVNPEAEAPVNPEAEAPVNPEAEAPYFPTLVLFNTNLIPIQHPNIRIVFDTKIKTPLLVEYRLSQDNSAHTRKAAKTHFTYDPTIVTSMQLSPKTKITGYHHGHLGEKSLHSSSPESAHVVNYMTNIVMQKEKFNTRIWTQTERAVPKIIVRNAQTEVSCGPSFSTNTVIHDVRIADSFWKLVTGKDENGIIREQIGWIIPHNSPEDTDITSCEKSREEIEDSIGYRLNSHH